MKSRKSKKIPFCNTATEVDSGIWEFQVGGTNWRYNQTITLNLQLLNVQTNIWESLVMVTSVKEAGLFAEGYVAGLNSTLRPNPL